MAIASLKSVFTDRSNGSSPRLWGTGRQWRYLDFRHRFIPTSVGNGSRPRPWARASAVHPHVCGERGIPLNGLAMTARFIPTSVGNGFLPRLALLCIAVHPHVCGERIKRHQPLTKRPGSSPRLWGTDWRRLAGRSVWRFIPTSVGNGIDASASFSVSSVHPHVCGERFRPCIPTANRCGSSPRLWGTGAPPHP